MVVWGMYFTVMALFFSTLLALFQYPRGGKGARCEFPSGVVTLGARKQD